jgi:hypothetical protein
MLTKSLGLGGVAFVFCSLAAAALVGVFAVLGNTSLFGGSAPSRSALTDIPPDRLALYRQAARVCPGLDWSVLAGIGKVETDHGRSPLPGVGSGQNSAGAGGPMQFLEPTFQSVVARHQPWPPGGANPPSRYNRHDAIYAAAYNLCDDGAPRDVYRAIYAYNHADWYVREVLDQAHRYALVVPAGSGSCRGVTAPTRAAAVAVAFACSQLGQPYVWGGDGPAVNGGWDCSGLVQAAYRAAGIALPRTAQAQYQTGPPVPEGELEPGDLVFYGTGRDIHHVGLYLGGGEMVNAPDFHIPVRVGSVRYAGDDYFGASRPYALASNAAGTLH